MIGKSSLQAVEAYGTVAYKVAYARLPGCDVVCSLFLSQVAFWCSRTQDGWCYLTHDKLEADTGLSRKQQDRAANTLSGLGVISKTLRGVPAKIHYSVDFMRLEDLVAYLPSLVAPNGQSVLPKMSNQGCTKRADSIVQLGQTLKRTEREQERARKSIGGAQAHKPTKEEAIAYASEIGLETPDNFFDYYESNGWKIGGKAPMKDWKAAMRRWHQNNFQPSRQQAKNQPNKPKWNGFTADYYADGPVVQRL